MKNNNNKAGKIINIKLKGQKIPQPESPELSRLKTFDDILNEITNSVCELKVRESSEDEYDVLMHDVTRINLLVGGWHNILRQADPVEDNLLVEINKLRNENKQLKKALDFHKNIQESKSDKILEAQELMVQALESLQNNEY